MQAQSKIAQTTQTVCYLVSLFPSVSLSFFLSVWVSALCSLLPLVHQQLKFCCSIYVIYTENTLCVVLRILMSCLRYASYQYLWHNELNFRCWKWLPNETHLLTYQVASTDHIIFTYDENHFVRIALYFLALALCKWLIGGNLYSIPSAWCLFVYQYSSWHSYGQRIFEFSNVCNVFCCFCFLLRSHLFSRSRSVGLIL